MYCEIGLRCFVNLLQNTVKMQGINEHITCRLCAGYLIDATTITECLHTCELRVNTDRQVVFIDRWFLDTGGL